MKNKLTNKYTVILSMVLVSALSACTKDQDFGKLQDAGIAQSISGTTSTDNPSSGCAGSGCPVVCPGDPSCPSGVNTATDSFTISQTSNNKVDILFVVDNSGSMGDNQANLANAFSGFIAPFSTSNVDYQIGVVSTTVRDAGYTSSYNFAQSLTIFNQGSNFSDGNPYLDPVVGKLLRRTNNDKVIKKGSTQDVVRQFAGRCTHLETWNHSGTLRSYFATDSSCPSGTAGLGNVQIGSYGNGYEQGLNSVIKFMAGSDKAALLRSDAKFAIIFVSDENEVITNNDGANDLAGLAGNATDAQKRTCNTNSIQNRINRFTTALNGKDAIMKFIVDVDGTDGSFGSNVGAFATNPNLTTSSTQRGYDYCGNTSGIGMMQNPEVYLKLAQQTSSVVADIDNDFTSTLTDIGNQIYTETIATTTLTHSNVVANSIVVTLNGSTVPKSVNNSDGWKYNAGAGTVTLTGIYAVPNGVVNITYNYN